MSRQLNLSRFLPYQLSIASNAVSNHISDNYRARFGLKIPEWRLMAVLGEGKPQTQRALVGVTRMDKVTVSRATTALEDRGLVERAASANDGRSHLLTLTEAGWSLYGEIAPAALAIERDIMSCLSADERRTLSDILVRLRDAADAAEAAAAQNEADPVSKTG